MKSGLVAIGALRPPLFVANANQDFSDSTQMIDGSGKFCAMTGPRMVLASLVELLKGKARVLLSKVARVKNRDKTMLKGMAS